MLPNDKLGEIIYKNMKEIHPPVFSREEHEFAKKLENTFFKGQKEKVHKDTPSAVLKDTLHEGIIETYDKGLSLSGSTDVGDVSQITPTAQFYLAYRHSWSFLASHCSQWFRNRVQSDDVRF